MILTREILFWILGICMGALIGHYFGWIKGHKNGWADKLKDINSMEGGQ